MIYKLFSASTSVVALAAITGVSTLGATTANAGKLDPSVKSKCQSPKKIHVSTERLRDVGFDEHRYYELNPTVLAALEQKISASTNTNSDIYALRLCRFAETHIINSLTDKSPEGFFWKQLNVPLPLAMNNWKNLLRRNAWIEEAFRNSRKGIRAAAEGEGTYRLFLAEFAQDIARASTRNTRPLTKEVSWDFASINKSTPWVRLFKSGIPKQTPSSQKGKGKGEEKEEDSSGAKTHSGFGATGSIHAPIDATGSQFFSKLVPSTPVTAEDWERIRRARQTYLRELPRMDKPSEPGNLIAPQYHYAPTRADRLTIPDIGLPAAVTEHLSDPAMDFWSTRGDGRCFWHAAGYSPQEFVERNIAILLGDNDDDKRSLLGHIRTDIADIIARHNVGERCVGTIGHPERALNTIFGEDNLAGQDLNNIMNTIFRDSATGELNNQKIAQYLWARYVGCAYTPPTNPHPELGPEPGLVHDGIEPIDWGMVNIEAIDHIGRIMGMGIVVVAESPSQTNPFIGGQFQPNFIRQSGLPAAHYAAACHIALQSQDEDLRRSTFNDIANQIFNIKQNLRDVEMNSDIYRFDNNAATISLLGEIFPETFSTFNRQEVYQWTCDPENLPNVRRFLRERFVNRSIIFQAYLDQRTPGVYQWVNYQDTLAERDNWVLVPNTLFDEIDAQLEQRGIALHPARELQVTYANIDEGNWVTILRRGVHFSALHRPHVVPRFAEQLVLEELHRLTGLGHGSFDELSFNQYIQEVGNILPSVWTVFGDILEHKYGITQGTSEPVTAHTFTPGDDEDFIRQEIREQGRTIAGTKELLALSEREMLNLSSSEFLDRLAGKLFGQ